MELGAVVLAGVDEVLTVAVDAGVCGENADVGWLVWGIWGW